jgi:hypothetical protein
MKLAETLKQEFNLPDENISGHESDLYILPRSEDESKRICRFIKSHGFYFEMSYSDVKDQPWYGKRFIEIPFVR